MRFSISSDKAFHGNAIAFVNAIGGPRIEAFLPRDYGNAVQRMTIILESEDPPQKLKHYSRYFPEDRWLYLHVVLGDELELGDERAVFEAIVATILAVVRKSFRKLKGGDFDGSRLDTDLVEFFNDSVNKRKPQGRAA